MNAKINGIILDINSIKKTLLDYKLTDDVEEKERQLDKKRKQLNYPFFTEELEKIVFSFVPSFVNLFIKDNVVQMIRGIKDQTSEEIEVEIPLEFELKYNNQEKEEDPKVGNIYLRRMDKNKYAYISGTCSLVN